MKRVVRKHALICEMQMQERERRGKRGWGRKKSGRGRAEEEQEKEEEGEGGANTGRKQGKEGENLRTCHWRLQPCLF